MSNDGAGGAVRIDAHQHFWSYNATDYVWMGPEHEVLRRDFLPSDLSPLVKSAGFSGTIAVQARQLVEETRWLLELADSNGLIRGVVGWVDLRSEGLISQIQLFANHPKLVGVRHVVHDEPDDQFVLRPEFIRGISSLSAFELTYDLLLFPRHLRPAIELVDKFPSQSFVVDHIAKPPIRDGRFSPWREEICELAQRSNVFCKVSGMVTEADQRAWKYEDFVPYLDIVMEAFGPNRCMIGSDWPVCTLAGEYEQVMGIVVRYLESFSEDERSAVLGGTCTDFYGIIGP